MSNSAQFKVYFLIATFLLVAMQALTPTIKANFVPSIGVYITLKKPQNITYSNNTIQVELTVGKVLNLRSGISVSYSLDNMDHKPVPNLTTIEDEILPYNPSVYLKTMKANFLLYNLSEGTHKIIAYCKANDQSQLYTDEDIVEFFVNTIPVISLLSIENKTYENSDIALNFTVSQIVSQIKYSLDNQKNVTINGNTTLTNLPNGFHNITVYATSKTGNTGASETISFTIAAPPPKPEQSLNLPSTIEIALIVILIVVGLGIAVNIVKKRRA